ncbi:YegP family protein [Solihabitans fulvus]|uniref:YegP family protein n=1 Tax=Solihabitans fulvus TaxID=1892852 RepID=UPI0016620938|nr:YegP family protein [Solihabitans fulvus]
MHTEGKGVAVVFKILPATNGQWYFRIMSGSNILATSETYVSKASARNTAQLIINNAGTGRIEE